jgi:hypothetical protein
LWNAKGGRIAGTSDKLANMEGPSHCARASSPDPDQISSALAATTLEGAQNGDWSSGKKELAVDMIDCRIWSDVLVCADAMALLKLLGG